MRFGQALLLFLVIVALATVKADDVEEDAEEVAPEEVEEYKPPSPTGPTNFHEAFLTEDVLWKRWVKSEAKKDGVEEEIAKYDGEWAVESAEEQSLKGDLGLVLKSKAKHHAIAVRLDTPFVFDEDTFIVQYEVKFQNGMECGGAYIKLLADDPDLESFRDKTRYSIMFGPDKCGADSKLHFIFQHKNPSTGEYEEKHAKKPSGFNNVFTDKKSHLFTLIIQPDNTYEVLVDQRSVSSGSLLEDFTPSVNPPAEVEDPDDHRPEDWDDRKKIADPDAVKPDDWDEDAPARIPDPDAVKPAGWLDDEPELINDPDAEKPDDWDDDLDGEWEPPQIANPLCEEVGCGEWEVPLVNNPDFKGKWKSPMIDNPDYSGEWKPKIIPNPDFFEDLDPFKMSSIGAIGLELWSMTENIYFDNFIITSERAVADNWADDTWKLRRRSSSEESVVSSIMSQLEEKPWLWVVIGLVVIIPLFLCFRFCFGGSKSEEEQEPSDSKKTDEPSAAGDQENEEEEGGEEGEEDKEEEEKEEEGEDGVRQRKTPSKKADLEEASQEEDDGEADNKKEKGEETKGDSDSVRKSPRQKSRKD